jgi:hypothetical protein
MFVYLFFKEIISDISESLLCSKKETNLITKKMIGKQMKYTLKNFIEFVTLLLRNLHDNEKYVYMFDQANIDHIDNYQ